MSTRFPSVGNAHLLVADITFSPEFLLAFGARHFLKVIGADSLNRVACVECLRAGWPIAAGLAMMLPKSLRIKCALSWLFSPTLSCPFSQSVPSGCQLAAKFCTKSTLSSFREVQCSLPLLFSQSRPSLQIERADQRIRLGVHRVAALRAKRGDSVQSLLSHQTRHPAGNTAAVRREQPNR